MTDVCGLLDQQYYIMNNRRGVESMHWIRMVELHLMLKINDWVEKG